MPNPYHDSQGRFASRDELKNLVQAAYDEGRIDDYIRERANLEEIENKVSKITQEDEAIRTTSQASLSAASRQLGSFESPSDAEDRVGDSMDWDISEILPSNMEDADPYSLGDDKEPYKFSAYTLDSYVALASNTSHFDAMIDSRSVMNDHYSFGSFQIYEPTLIHARKKASRSYREENKIYEGRLAKSKNPITESDLIRQEVLSKRQENLKKLKRAKFELAYILNQSQSSGSYQVDAEKEIVEQMKKIQISHDAVIYSHAMERTLDRFLKEELT